MTTNIIQKYVTPLKWNEELNVIFMIYMFRVTHYYSATGLARITCIKTKKKKKKKKKKTQLQTLRNVNMLLIAESSKDT